MLLAPRPWYRLEFVCEGTLQVRGWRREVYRACTSVFGYIEPEDNIKYIDSDLHVKCWFRDEDHLRSCAESILASHKCFCASCNSLKITIDLSPQYDVDGLKPLMSTDYVHADSSSPEYTEVSNSDTAVSFASLSNADVVFQMIENVSMFSDINPTGCHIADKAVHPQYDKLPDNRIYLSHDMHSRFDGMQTNDTAPHIGIYFVQFAGTEEVEYGGKRCRRDKVIVGVEIPYPGVVEKINFKTGSYMEEGNMHTFVHVRSHEIFKCLLDLKYAKTTARWKEKAVAFNVEAKVDIAATIDELDRLLRTQV